MLYIFIYFLLVITASHKRNNIRSGTSIIAIITNTSIWLGADSKSEYNDITKKELLIDNAFCKIQKTKNIFYGVSGIYQASFNQVAYNIYDLLNEAIAQGKTFDASLNAADNEIKSHITATFIQTQKKPNRYFGAIINKPFTSFIACMSDKGIPIYTRVDYILQGTPTNWRIISQKSIGKSLEILGKRQYILNYLTANKITQFNSPRDSIVKYITILAKAYPLNVGLPIDIIVFDKSGYHWVQKKQGCN